jgi:CCR4-NOT transcription complex subunit 2
MSEFPALGSRMGSLSLDASFEGSAADRMRAQPSEFTIQKEDFPALSTFGPGASEKSPLRPPTELKRHSSFTSSAADGLLSSRAEQQKGGTSIGSRVGSAAQPAAAAAGSVNLGTEAFDHFRAPRPDEQAATEEPSNGELDPSNQYGLLGMLHTIIRPASDAKKNLAMGCDLTSLGLNLNAAE